MFCKLLGDIVDDLVQDGDFELRHDRASSRIKYEKKKTIWL